MSKVQTIFVLLLLAVSVAAQPSGYKIAFNTPEDSKMDDYDVYSMNIDGTGIKNITNHKDVAWTYYAWKDRLFFVSDRGVCRRCYFLHESDADGNNVKKVSNLQLEDAWLGARNDGATPDGKKQWKLTDGKLDEGWHDWSPDGEWLAFDSRDEATGRYEVYVMNYKTKETKKITGSSPLKYHQAPVFVAAR